MGIRSLRTASISTGVKRSKVWDQSAVVATNSYESIATATGTGSSGVITFSSIPSTYKHLELRAIARNTGSSNEAIYLRFNGDTGANYSLHFLRGNATNVVASAQINYNQAGLYWAMGMPFTTNLVGPNVTSILDYANTDKFKTIRALDGFDNSASGAIELISGAWRSTSAITSITLTANSGVSFTTNTHFALYGIKG